MKYVIELLKARAIEFAIVGSGVLFMVVVLGASWWVEQATEKHNQETRAAIAQILAGKNGKTLMAAARGCEFKRVMDADHPGFYSEDHPLMVSAKLDCYVRDIAMAIDGVSMEQIQVAVRKPYVRH